MMIRNDWRLWVMVVIVLETVGCGITPPSGERAGVTLPQEGVPPAVQVVPSPAPQGSSAVVALLNSAAAKEHSGQYDQAAASLERALRLEPRNAMLWHRLSRVRMKQGQWQVAVDMAAKSNTLAGDNSELRSWNWAVIAEAKEQLGDRLGAQEARSRVNAGGATR